MRAAAARFDTAPLALGRLPGLAAALEAACVEAPAALAPFAGAGVVAEPGEVAESTLQSVCEAHADGFGAWFAAPEYDCRLLLAFDRDAPAFALAAAFGAGELSAGERRAPTAIDLALLREFACGLGRAIEAGLRGIAPLALQFDALAPLATRASRGEAPVALAHFVVSVGASQANVALALPQALLQSLRPQFAAPPAPRAPDPRWLRGMETGIGRAEVQVSAVMEELPSTLGEVAQFAVGRILDLAGDGAGRVRLESGGRPLCWARLGQGEGRYSLTIEEPVAEETPLPLA